MPPSDESERVGYGRPPKSGQFKPGMCANPNGRRGSRPRTSSGSSVERILAEPVGTTKNDRGTQMTKEEYLVHKTVALAAKGDVSAARLLFRMQSAEKRDRTSVAIELLPIANKFKSDWKRAYERGLIPSLEHLPISPDAIVIDLIRGRVRIKVASEGGEESYEDPQPETLLALLKAYPPPALSEEPERPRREDLVAEFVELAAKARASNGGAAASSVVPQEEEQWG